MKKNKNYNYVDIPEPTGKSDYFESKIRPNWHYIRTLLIDGHTEAQVAEAIGISRATWNKWKKQRSDFREHINTSRMKLVSELEDSLYRRALGIESETTTIIKQYYNKYTGEWIDQERQISINENRANNTTLIAALKYLSPGWRKALTNQPDEEKDDINEVIDSIGTLIDKIREK